jgi:hypothetical protein
MQKQIQESKFFLLSPMEEICKNVKRYILTETFLRMEPFKNNVVNANGYYPHKQEFFGVFNIFLRVYRSTKINFETTGTL